MALFNSVYPHALARNGLAPASCYVSPSLAPSTGKKPTVFKTIEAGRGIAAMFVLLYHASCSFSAAEYWHIQIFDGVFDIGYIGVEFFFVLSGFIIVQVHALDIGQPHKIRRYVEKRFIRIYPVYWIVLAMMIAASGVTGLGQPLTGSIVWQSIVLVGPNEDQVPLTAAWTLFHEIAFYVVFGLCIVNARIGGVVVAAWLSLVAMTIFGVPVGWLPAYLGAPVNLLFAFGAIACWVSSRALIPAPGAVAGAAALAFIGCALEIEYVRQFSETTNTLLLGSSAAVGLAAIVTLERRRPIAVHRLLLSAGAASYSIYLVHAPIIAALSKLAVRSGASTAWPPALSFIALITVPAALGYAFHRIIERPVLRWASVGVPSLKLGRELINRIHKPVLF